MESPKRSLGSASRPRGEPFAAQSAETLALIQTWLRDELPRQAAGLGGVGAECYGVTVNARDLARVTENDRLRPRMASTSM